MALFEKPKLF
uniref:Uncharacterized protein n=1 Tax=Arundo donax TaxID=35708 RepID=A0A0A9CF35_ARUDO